MNPEQMLKMALQNPQLARDILDKADSEESLAGFVKAFWTVLEPGRTMVWGWALDAVCDHLEAVSRGEIKRLMINIPPGCMKSLLVNVFWPAWEWGPNGRPQRRFIGAAYAEQLSIRDNRKCRTLVEDAKYQRMWPHLKINPDQRSASNFANMQMGFKLATSVGGTATGERGDVFVVDDPLSVGDGDSDAKRIEALHWFTETMPTRLNDPENDAIVMIMQRIHEEDPSGHVIDADLGWDRLVLPMEFEPNHPYLSKTQIGFVDPRKEEGELLFPERFTRKYIEEELKPHMRSLGGEYAEAGQLQQRPNPRGGGMFKKDNFELIDQTSLPTNRKGCRGWDLAATKSKRAAFTAGVKMSIDEEGRIYIEDVQRIQGSSREVELLLLRCAEEDGPEVPQDLPQDPGQAGKAQVAHLARLLNGHPIKFGSESGSKEDRARPLASQTEAGNVYLVKGPWNKAFLAEIESFPAGRFKDQVDAASRAYARIIPKRDTSLPVPPEIIE